MHLPVKQSIYKQKETKETYPEGTVNQRVLGSSPREGANEKEVFIDLFFYGKNQSLISYSLLNLLKKDQITSQAFIS